MIVCHNLNQKNFDFPPPPANGTNLLVLFVGLLQGSRYVHEEFFIIYVANNFAIIWFNAASVTIFSSSISINDSEQRCFGVSHNLRMNYVQVDKHQLGTSRYIKRVVGDEFLRCESAMDMTGSFLADMVARSISYTFET